MQVDIFDIVGYFVAPPLPKDLPCGCADGGRGDEGLAEVLVAVAALDAVELEEDAQHEAGVDHCVIVLDFLAVANLLLDEHHVRLVVPLHYQVN